MTQNMTEDLRLSDLSVGYAKRRIIDGLSLAPIAPGSVVSLIGPNAAGKTTLLRAIAGLLPAGGALTLGERDLRAMVLADHARLVTYMPQNLPERVALTVLEGVVGALRASPIDGPPLSDEELLERALGVIERVGITPLAMTGLDRLSGGQRQLASLAQALVRSPRVLLLDEPISALDLHYQLRVMKLVHALARERGMIVLMVLHDLSIAARWSDRIIVLSKGRVAADGAPAEAITAPVLAEVYNVVGQVEAEESGLRITIKDILPHDTAAS
ncbi:ABC transporter ATP-binding protein [Pontibaca methylaminivorans]|uniref:Iron complex transport system ATP-binding protein n=1 Tax=Pontibaca methylaminivorans TaxID=515897 RepID=A0A1R3X154_9RHOB|nr:ABC transporter ATP-binding protein [Pontibaca methylaminivorans]SIT83890.1 iron complex transport system ATP-binding protein [Pontibaca methylaminivorans]